MAVTLLRCVCRGPKRRSRPGGRQWWRGWKGARESGKVVDVYERGLRYGVRGLKGEEVGERDV
jgi:hypothetical protein